MSSPARTTVSDDGPTARPTEGRSRGWGVVGNWVASLERGLRRMRDLGPGSEERKRRRPEEEAAGEKDGGRGGGRGRRCHVEEEGSKRSEVELEWELVGKKRKEG